MNVLFLSLMACTPERLVTAAPGTVDTSGDTTDSDDAETGANADTATTDTGAVDTSATDTGATDTGATDTSPADTSDTGAEDTADAAPLQVAVISDLNGSYGSTTYGSEVHAAVAALVADPPDVVLVTGDMVAGQQSGLDYPAMWRGFHSAVTTPLTDAGIPVAVTPGNHDASGYSGYAAERAEYARQWDARVPAVTMVDATNYPFRYAFTVRDTLFVSLDATTIGPLSSSQRAWVDDVLATPAAHRIVFAHVPIHAFTVGRETEILDDDALEDILVSHGVDLFVSGHHHGYYPGRHGDLRVVSMACTGSGSRALIGTSDTSPKSILRFTLDTTGIADLDAYGGSRFTSPIARSTLPTRVGSGAGAVTRDDL